MSIEIFCPKLVVSNIFAFLDHLKPKIFFFGHGGRHRVPPHFEISGSTSDNHPLFIISSGRKACIVGDVFGWFWCKKPKQGHKKNFFQLSNLSQSVSKSVSVGAWKLQCTQFLWNWFSIFLQFL